MMNPNRALDRAKIGILQHGSVFLSTITFSMTHTFNDAMEIPTARTDGRKIEYNTNFFMSMTHEERISLIAHEAWHVALNHISRCGERNQKRYNKAGDYVINQLLVDSGFSLHDSATQNNKYRNMSTDEVYNLLEEEEEEPTQDNQDIVFSSDSADDDKDQEGDGKGMSTQSIQAHILGMLVSATTRSKMQQDKPGSIPGEITRLIDKLINPILPWGDMLQRFLTEKVKDDYTWARPNKRYMPDFYLPTQHSEALTHITIAIDTSGSITENDLTAILSEINFIKDTLKPKKLTILDCDYSIHNVYEVTEDMDVRDLTFSGGGGTSCFPVFEYIEKHPTTALIYFTDLYLSPYTKKVNFPVLWVVYDNPHASVQIGEITHYSISNKR